MRIKKRALQQICWFVIIVALVNIGGWLADIEFLKSGIPGLASMKVNTAICLMLCAVVVLLFDHDAHKHFNTILPLNIIVLVISSLTIFEHIFDVNLNIDEFMVEEETTNVMPGRMALTSATCLALLATGFSMVIVQLRGFFNIVSRACFYFVTLIAFLALVGYIFNIPSLHNLSLSKSMALITAISLLPLSLAYSSLLPVRVNR